MVDRRLTLALFLTLMVMVPSLSRAGLIVNEVLSNEPGSDRDLEWFELYNTNEADTFSLAFYRVDANGTEISFFSEVMRGESYAVVCKKLYGNVDDPGFETIWGNASGVWGDDASENYQVFVKPGFTLNNASGSVILYYLGNQISSLAWDRSGEDGVSWERLGPQLDEIIASKDPSGSTPGRANSSVPQPFDLALLDVTVRPEPGGFTGLDFLVANVGTETVTDDSLYLFNDPERDSVAGRNDLMAVIPLPGFERGDTLLIEVSAQFNGFYIDVLAKLMADDRPENNLLLFTAPGDDYPPIRLSEFLPDPVTPLETEWVELQNLSDKGVNIDNWYLGDLRGIHPIVTSEYIVPGGVFVVLCRDSLAFVDYYGEPDYPVIELSGWPVLNNDTTETIKLIDNYGFMADSVVYDSGFGGNLTWGRSSVPGMADVWGRSADTGGTPGAENNVYFPASASTIAFSASPNPFSPSRDKLITFEFSLPPGVFDMKLYDVEGRVVKVFYEDFPTFDGAVEWDGYSDSGRRLPMGIYVIMIDVFDKDQYKRTIVIGP